MPHVFRRTLVGGDIVTSLGLLVHLGAIHTLLTSYAPGWMGGKLDKVMLTYMYMDFVAV